MPQDDQAKGVVDWAASAEIAKKRLLFWKIGSWCEVHSIEKYHTLGIILKLYSLLPLPSLDTSNQDCFYPAADLPVKKKISQVERQIKVGLGGTGSVMVRVIHWC
jgi:hypothetical protein